MISTLFDELFFNRLLHPDEQDSALMELYNGLRARGQAPTLCAQFINRIEQLLDDLSPPSSSPLAASRRLRMIDNEFSNRDFQAILNQIKPLLTQRNKPVQITPLPASGLSVLLAD